MGWGQAFGNHLQGNIKLVNAARSGASTRTFLYEALFLSVEVQMKKGDFLIIQFGHNDAKAGDPRYAEANTEYIENLTKFIETAREYGVTSIVLSSIERRNGTIENPTHGEYPAAAAIAAKNTGMGFINITAKTAALFESLGDEGTKKLFLHLPAGVNPNYPQGVADDTHLQEAGAQEVARLVAEGLKEIDSPLAVYLK
jgi:lysophospholipase L1-like esterase